MDILKLPIRTKKMNADFHSAIFPWHQTAFDIDTDFISSPFFPLKTLLPPEIPFRGFLGRKHEAVAVRPLDRPPLGHFGKRGNVAHARLGNLPAGNTLRVLLDTRVL